MKFKKHKNRIQMNIKKMFKKSHKFMSLIMKYSLQEQTIFLTIFWVLKLFLCSF